MFTEQDIVLMQEALNTAQVDYRAVAPNPMVGCVIVHNNVIVAHGAHQKFGGPHAEVNAINNLPTHINSADCTLYVTLEPCSHFGKTPPCADLIISKGFKKVVVATTDPNPLVAGAGIKKLQQAGVEVKLGLLQAEAIEQNRKFFTYQTKKRPYYFLKWAQTANGLISRLPVPANRADNIISGEQEQHNTHKLRSQYMGIMVGKQTVLKDNPRLTTRLMEGQNPTRIFIDRNLVVPEDYHIYDNEAPSIVFNGINNGEKGHIHFIKLDFSLPVLPQINAHLYHLKIQSVMVEGGANLLQQFINEQFWDEYRVIVNPHLNFETGVKAPQIQLDKNPVESGNNLVYSFKKPVVA